MSYYQKYRPEKIAELDLVSVREEFEKTLKSGHIGHAYLFVGPRGSGKTSTARILARVVNCEKNISGEPCGECNACVTIKNQSAVDVIEIDAASHRGIDDIRDLREKIKLTPVILKKKVYIIDEVHMLTNEAFNALLKTLEEPPAHAMFILCTTEVHKVPETIASRCVKLMFYKATVAEVRTALEKAIKGEGIKIDKDALDILTESVDGSLREAHKVLEQLAQTGEKIDLERVKTVLGLMGSQQVELLIKAVEEGNVAEVVEIMKSCEEKATDSNALIKGLLQSLEQRLFKKIEAKKDSDFEKEMIKGLIDVAPQIKTSPLPLLPIELFCVEMVEGRVKSQELRGKKKEVCVGARDPSAKPQDDGQAISFNKIVADWPQLLNRLAPRNHSVAGLLRGARPKEIDGGKLIIEVFYKFHKEQLEQEDRRNMIEEEATRLWGPMTVKCILGERASAKDEIKIAEEVFG